MSIERQQHELEAGIRALEAQRGLLGDEVVDTSVAGLRAKLAGLATAPAALAEPAETAQALKQVTILFLDVVESTTLSQHLDPEAISAVMDDALARATAVVQAHGGRVLQYAGDNILAAFGANEVREDDVERAVRCGLALLDLGKTLGLEVQAAHGRTGFNVRVGLHTGSVLLGGGVDADGSIRGIAVNIAARMEQTAPAGALRISHDTYAPVRGLFEVEVQDPLTVKGVDTPMQSYLVLRAKPRNFHIGSRGIEGVATKMVGRDAELEALQTAFKRRFAKRQLTTVTVVADAGVGKSRLLYEFEAWSEARPERFFLFRGRAKPQTLNQAYGLLRDILAWRFQIADDDSVEAARAKMEGGIIPLFQDESSDLAESHAHLLGHLIGIDWSGSRHVKGILDDPKQIRDRAFSAAAQLFRRVVAGEGSPVVVQLEDLHWADSESLDFLQYMVEINGDLPLLVLASTRPTLFERRADWLLDPKRSEKIHQRIDLAPLDKSGSRMLVQELLKQLPEVPVALRELLTSSAEGNPFYMEELVKMLIDQGAIATGATWTVHAERLLLTKVPPTLTGVLQARLDGLPANEKHALQQASVVGAVFWDQALAAVDSQAAEQLPALTRRELTVPRVDAALEGLREYAFRHQILHQVTYDTVLKRHKREGHAKVAQWLARLTEQGNLHAGDLLGLTAEHFEQAGDRVHAAEFHGRAAEHAGQRFAHERVLVHVERALALIAEPASEAHSGQAELRWRLLDTREHTLDLQARRSEQAADLDSLAQLADALGDDRRRAEVARRQALRAGRMADWAAMEAAAHYGIACATRAADDGLRLHSLRFLAAARVWQGDPENGRTLALQGLAEARKLGLRGVEARLLGVLSIAADLEGDRMGMLRLGQETLQIYRETGDRIPEAIALTNMGVAWLGVGDLAQARRDLDGALQMLRANGDRVIEGAALGTLSLVALWQGDAAMARALARSSMDIAVATQARDKEISAGLYLGDAELALGNLAAAREAYARSLGLALELHFPGVDDASAGLARVALAEGDAVSALAALQPVVDRAAGGTLDLKDSRQIELTCHQVLARAGDPRALEWLSRAHTALMIKADAISDASLRRSFLNNIPVNREIVAAWTVLGAEPR